MVDQLVRKNKNRYCEHMTRWQTLEIPTCGVQKTSWIHMQGVNVRKYWLLIRAQTTFTTPPHSPWAVKANLSKLRVKYFSLAYQATYVLRREQSAYTTLLFTTALVKPRPTMSFLLWLRGMFEKSVEPRVIIFTLFRWKRWKYKRTSLLEMESTNTNLKSIQ